MRCSLRLSCLLGLLALQTAEALEITRVSPRAGPVSGGTLVTINIDIYGNGPGLTVLMPGEAAIQSATAHAITVLTPPHGTGQVDIQVIDYYGATDTAIATFEYFDAPTILSKDLVAASVGGTPMKILGENFVPNGVEVHVGDTQILDFSVAPYGTQISFVAPPAPAGTTELTITNIGLGSSTVPLTYQALSLDSLSDSQGPAVVNNEVVLYGQGLSSKQTVYFGEQVAPQYSVSPTAMTVWTPYRQTVGAVDVTIKSPDGSAATLPFGYAFRQSRPQFDIYTEIPSSGYIWLYLTGIEVDCRQARILVGRIPALAYDFSECGDTVATFRYLAPPAPAGTYNVTIINSDGGKFTQENALTYLQSPLNDNCSQAYPLIFDGPMYFELNRATPDTAECPSAEPYATVWYRFTSAQDGYLDVYPSAKEKVRIDLLQECCGTPVVVPTGCVAPESCLSNAAVAACEDYLIRVSSTRSFPSGYDGPTTIYAAFRPVPDAVPCAAEGEGEGEGEGTSTPTENTVDTDHDGRISLSELLRLVQFYRLGIGCGVDTEDGFDPGSADHTCAHYSADYNPTDWQVSLSEALRAIQLYSAGAYHPCPEGEDGFCPGP